MNTSNRNANRASAGSSLAAAWPAALLILAGLAAYAAVASNTIMYSRLEFDEVGYLVKSWWYVTGALKPYSAADSSLTMPGFPFGLGGLQIAMGLSATAARMAMVGLGLMNGILLFLLSRKLTANPLAAAAGVMIFLGAPATAYSFSTATPVALISLFQIISLWLLVMGLGRPKIWLSLVMGLVLAAQLMCSSDMVVPVLLLILLFFAAAGRGRWLHGPIVLIVIAAVIAATLYVFPDQFTTYLLNQPIVLVVRDLTGLAPIGRGLPPPMRPDYDIARIQQDLLEGVLMPYGGTILLGVLLIALTLRGPRVLWIPAIYVIVSLASGAVFLLPGCDTCAATAPSQVIVAGALSAAMALAFLSRWRRQHQGAGSPLVIGGALAALTINTFAPGLATRDVMHFFPAATMKQTRPVAEQRDIPALMRFIGQNASGTEPILLLHKLPALPYAVHMAGRKFPAASLNPAAQFRAPAASDSQREAALAAIERGGGWSDATMKRWVQRDYDMILWQDGVLPPDNETSELLGQLFDVAGTTEFRGAKLTLYKRKG
ncbi:MAG: hypothetical protein EXR11_00310 [Rhodospirillaceae bacterium]|nr:hypothetical protein [Rhodospirillaceae bacterium]